MRRSLSIVVVAAAVLAPAAGWLGSDAAAQTRPGQGFVRLEPAESGAPPNEHPAQIEPTRLKAILASIHLKGSRWADGGAVFDDKELAEIAPGIADALGKASRTDDISFAVFGRHGPFGQSSPATVTSGRVFVQQGRLNVILGLVQTRYEDMSFNDTVEIRPGLRARRLQSSRALAADTAKAVAGRDDWLQFDPSAAPPEPIAQRPAPAAPPKAAATPARPEPPSDDTRYQEIQARLRTLDRLKADGLITEEEYRERRRAILQSL